MPLKEILDIVVAVGTLLAAVFAGISARETTNPIKLQANAIDLQPVGWRRNWQGHASSAPR